MYLRGTVIGMGSMSGFSGEETGILGENPDKAQGGGSDSR
jgi:hypothetical protein